jgi:adenylate cyclase
MAEERAQRRLAAILAADVVGYSRLMEQDEAGTLAILKRRRQTLLEPLVVKHHGRIFKVTGDGVLVEFGSAVNAVQCAVDLQRAMADANTDQSEDRQVVLRIGVNLGDVAVEGSDLYGDGVIVAARLEALAEPGGILVSRTIHDHIKGKLKVSFDDMGALALKNFAEPIQAFRVEDMPGITIPTTDPISARPSIAILPFTNISGDPEQEYFSDGITEDIITDLSRVSALFVVARNTSFTFKGKAVEVAKAARQMKVAYILEGSVRKAGNRVRITAQLIDGKTGGHIWAERYDRDFGDIFALQDSISKSVVSALKVKLLPEEFKSIADRSTSNAEAYRHYLLGRSLSFGEWGNRRVLRTARQMFAKAIEIDPEYSRAYAGLADCDANLWAAGDSDVSFNDILINSSKALERYPNLAEAHASKGYALWLAGYQEDALESLKRALELDSNLYEAYWHYGEACREAGRPADAVAPLERAVELRPTDFWPIGMLSATYQELGREAESRLAAYRAFSCIEAELQRRPDNANALALGAIHLGYFGEKARCEEWATRAIALEPDNFSVRYNVACAYATMDKLDAALEHLEYMNQHIPRARRWLFRIAQIDADLNLLRHRPEYQMLMKAIETELRKE